MDYGWLTSLARNPRCCLQVMADGAEENVCGDGKDFDAGLCILSLAAGAL